MQDLEARVKAAVAKIEGRDPKLADELNELRGSAKTKKEARALAPAMALRGLALEGAAPRPAVALETIVLRVGRPVLAVVRDEALLEFQDAESEIWRQRLTDARDRLVPAIKAVGRIEVENHPRFEWLGTGWLVADDVVVTNRHVAREFGRGSGSGFVFRPGRANRRMTASIDFLEEFDRPESLEFRLRRILHIEGDGGPDVALLQVEPVAGRGLAAPIRLGVRRGAGGAAGGRDRLSGEGQPDPGPAAHAGHLRRRLRQEAAGAGPDHRQRGPRARCTTARRSAATPARWCSTSRPARRSVSTSPAASWRRTSRCPPRSSRSGCGGSAARVRAPPRRARRPARAALSSRAPAAPRPPSTTISLHDPGPGHGGHRRSGRRRAGRARRARHPALLAPTPADVGDDEDEILLDVEARPEDYADRPGYTAGLPRLRVRGRRCRRWARSWRATCSPSRSTGRRRASSATSTSRSS